MRGMVTTRLIRWDAEREGDADDRWVHRRLDGRTVATAMRHPGAEVEDDRAGDDGRTLADRAANGGVDGRGLEPGEAQRGARGR
eukprot:3126967-Pyramimonas_sp.AAC.1